MPIVRRLQAKGCVAVARHRFGCRVLERLIEHGDEGQLRGVIDELIYRAEELARHQFGNFVVQSLLEHGSEAIRCKVLVQLLPSLPYLSTHRTATHVVQQALNHCSDEGRGLLIESLLTAASPYSVAELATSRYGSYVLEELHSVIPEGAYSHVRAQLQAALPMFQDSASFQRVASLYGLL